MDADVEVDEDTEMAENGEEITTTEESEEKEEEKGVIEEGMPAGEVFKLGENWQQCPTEQATKIHKEIVHITIPKMHKLLTKKVSYFLPR